MLQDIDTLQDNYKHYAEDTSNVTMGLILGKGKNDGDVYVMVFIGSV